MGGRSMSDDRALEAAARAVYAMWQDMPTDWTDDNLPDNETREEAEEVSEAAVAAYLDHLLGELPEEAVLAAAQTLNSRIQSDISGRRIQWNHHKADDKQAWLNDANAALRNAVQSLREGLGGGDIKNLTWSAPNLGDLTFIAIETSEGWKRAYPNADRTAWILADD